MIHPERKREIIDKLTGMKAIFTDYHVSNLDISALTDSELLILDDAWHYMSQEDFRRTLDGVAIRQEDE